MLYQTQNPHGGDVYSAPVKLDYSANINPYGTPRAVLDAVLASLSQLSHYPDPYCRELVTAISRHEGVPREWILCGNGAAELIFSFCAGLHPRKALLLAPCFSEYETALRAFGADIEHYFLRESDAFRLTEDFLPALEKFDGDTLMLCNPNNPTGQIIAPALLGGILEICTRKGISILLDECFLDMTEGGAQLSMKTQLQTHPKLLILKAFTKAYGMAGLRLGYCLCAEPRLLQKMGASVQAWNVSIPAQMAGVAALTQGDFLEKGNALVSRERPRLAQSMKKLGFTVIPSQTNYLLFSAPRDLKEQLSRRGILIRSCANYPGLGEGWFRIAVKLPEENEMLIRAMEEIING